MGIGGTVGKSTVMGEDQQNYSLAQSVDLKTLARQTSAQTVEQGWWKTMKGLKPCPFCGGNAWLREKTLRLLGIDYTTRKKKARIAMYCYCGKCKARGGVVTGTFSFVTYISTNDRERLKKQAIEAWNRREKNVL